MPLWLWLRSHYATLCVAPTASFDEIKRAFRTKSLEHHPDRNPERVEFATWWFKQVQAAWEILKDAASRNAHDAELLAQWQERCAKDAEMERRMRTQLAQSAPQPFVMPTVGEAFAMAAIDAFAHLGVMWLHDRVTSPSPPPSKPASRSAGGRARRR